MASMIIRSRVIICTLLLLGPMLFQVERAGAQIGAPTPLLNSASITTPFANEMLVHGVGFSPGGTVHVAIYDLWGTMEIDRALFVASSATYGPEGSQDPAQGYTKGGLIDGLFLLNREAVYGPNGSQDPAQGYVAATTSRTDAASTGAPIFGPNGSQDPAQGYDDGAPISQSAAGCVRDVMVRAYDFGTKAWSNLLDTTIGC